MFSNAKRRCHLLKVFHRTAITNEYSGHIIPQCTQLRDGLNHDAMTLCFILNEIGRMRNDKVFLASISLWLCKIGFR